MHYCFMSSARLGIWSFKVQRCNNLTWSNGLVSTLSSPENELWIQKRVMFFFRNRIWKVGSIRCESHIHAHPHPHPHTRPWSHQENKLHRVIHHQTKNTWKWSCATGLMHVLHEALFQPRILPFIFHSLFVCNSTTLMWYVISSASHWRNPPSDNSMTPHVHRAWDLIQPWKYYENYGKYSTNLWL